MIVTFVLGVIFLVNYYFNWIDQLKISLGLASDQQAKLNSALGNLMIMLGAEAAIGFLAFLFFLLGSRSTTQIVSFSNSNNQNNSSNDLDTINENHTSIKNIREVEDILEQFFENEQKKMEKVLWKIANDLDAVQGAIFLTKQKDAEMKQIELFAGYAYYLPESKVLTYEFGEGLAGQVAKDGRLVNISSIPEGYISVISGLGKSSPTNLILVPIKNEQEEALGVIEIASFREFDQKDELFLKEVALLLAKEIDINQITA
ncbi:hypothetical protein BKI52_36410 [marine bacterium AO1-C]|nr:hypothetical protein BKI52_36410 [marine bacterium AO1-C]